MKKMLLIIIIIFTVIFVLTMSSQNSSRDCTGAPILFKSNCSEMNSWLDQKLIEWKPIDYKQMDFGVYHVYASDDMFIKSNADVDMKMLNVIEEVNPDIVILYIRPKSYFSQKERYDALIAKIRKDGKKLFIGARFEDEPKYFKTYEEALTQYTKDIIAVIKPDFFGIVIEPQTMEKQFGFDATDEEWVKLHERIAALSKGLSSATKTVAAGHSGELSFLRLVSGVKDIDIVGFNLYGIKGLSAEYSGYLGKGDVNGDAIDFVNSQGKETWIVETWTAAMVTKLENYASVQEYMKPIDAKWLRVMVYYAQKHNMKAIIPFFTGKFSYYGRDPGEFVMSLDKKEKTPAFESYKSIIEEVRNNIQ